MHNPFTSITRGPSVRSNRYTHLPCTLHYTCNINVHYDGAYEPTNDEKLQTFFPLKSKISLSLFLVLYLSRFLQQRLMRTCLISRKKNVATRYANIHPRYENISRDRSAEEQYLHESVERIQLRIERKFSWSAGNSFRGGGEEEGRESYSLVF